MLIADLINILHANCTRADSCTTAPKHLVMHGRCSWTPQQDIRQGAGTIFLDSPLQILDIDNVASALARQPYLRHVAVPFTRKAYICRTVTMAMQLE